MNNFFRFIWDNQFSFLFVLLESIGFFLLVSNNNFQKSSFNKATTFVSGNAYELAHGYQEYIGLRQENAFLAQQNAELMEKLQEAEEASQVKFKYETGSVISSSYHLGKNHIIIDRGAADGVEPHQGVIDARGVVGVIQKVSDHFSSVLPLIHTDSKVSCEHGPSGYFGLLSWDGFDSSIGLLEDIPNHVSVSPGDKVVTRGASGSFTSGLLVGFVTESHADPSSGFQSVKVEFATDFRNIKRVFLIQNPLQNELDSLKKEATHE